MRHCATLGGKPFNAADIYANLKDINGNAGVTITSLTATRVKGTFRGILVPQAGKPAKTSLAVTDGAFDVGIPQP